MKKEVRAREKVRGRREMLPYQDVVSGKERRERERERERENGQSRRRRARRREA